MPKKKSVLTDQLFEPIGAGQRYVTPERMNQNMAKPFPDANNPFQVIASTKELYKSTIPGFLYSPPYGLPSYKDVPEIRRLANTPFVSMISNTMCNEILGLDWDIKVREGEEVPENVIKEVRRSFMRPNANRNQDISNIASRNARDLIELGTSVTEKAYSLKGDFGGFIARDAGLFLKNPDRHGILPENKAYWQYSWTYSYPIPFKRDEIAWADYNERTDQEYGRGPVENLLDVLQLLLYGVDSNLEYFSDNSIPKGVFMMEGADKDAVDNFAKQFQDSMRKRDPAGKWRKYFHKMPMINQSGKFERISFSNIELDLIEQQKWYMKIVWACFGINADELGFTEDSNRATSVMQSSTFKRKAIRPLIETLEQCYDTNIINSHPLVVGKYEDMLMFEFDKTDMGVELQERQLHWGDYDRSLITKNQFLEKTHQPTVPDGDKYADEIRAEQAQQQLIGSNPFKQTTANMMEKKKEESSTSEDLPKSAEEKSLIGEPYEVKALGTASPLALDSFETPAEYKKAFRESFDEQLEKIIEAIRSADLGLVEQKALGIEGVLDRILGIVTMGAMSALGIKMVRDSYSKGIDKAGEETGRNYLPNTQALNFLQKYTFGNIRDLTNETRSDLRGVLMRGIADRKPRDEIISEVKDVLNASKNRAEVIVVTEMNRARNAGYVQGYKDSGMKGSMVWNTIGDTKADPDCRSLDGKKVPLGSTFAEHGYSIQSPPLHPNCRCRVTFESGVVQ